MVQENSNDKNGLLLGSDLNKKITDKLEKIKSRFDEINKQLEIPENYKDHRDELKRERVSAGGHRSKSGR